MKESYVSRLILAFVMLLPLLTGIAWLFYVLWVRHQPHWDSKLAFHLILFVPTMVTVGAVPQVLCQLWLMSRYGPLLELMPGWKRVFMEMPILLWGITMVVALLVFILLSGHRVTMKWW